jgi:hypothetical protein
MPTTTTLRLAAIAIGAVLLIAWTGVAQSEKPKPDTLSKSAEPTKGSPDSVKTPAHQVIVYYFHGTKRCATCLKLEAYTTEAVDSAFADQLKSGALVFRVVNTDSTGNEHFTEEYQLYTKSVILSDLHQGKQTRWKNLEKIWDLVDDHEAYLAYIRDEIRPFLDDTK